MLGVGLHLLLNVVVGELRVEPHIQGAGCASYKTWDWYVERSGADRCIVTLTQYQTVENASINHIRGDLQPDPECTRAPNLRRVAMVSAPVVDETPEKKPIADRLNDNIRYSVQSLRDLSARNGYYPNAIDYTDVAAYSRAQGEWFSVPNGFDAMSPQYFAWLRAVCEAEKNKRRPPTIEEYFARLRA